MDILQVSIGIGLVISLFFSEFFGLAAGGLIVPGYMAMYFNYPMDIFLTLLVSVAAFGFVRLISSVTIVYGKRRTALMIISGYIFEIIINSLGTGLIHSPDFHIIGYIIPGLIAIWIDRQGMVETFSTLITGSVIVRLVLIVIYGADLKI